MASCIASIHRDGYLRERAVRALAAAEGGLPARFLALRSVDHVDQVRQDALSALLSRANPVDAAKVLELLLRVRGRSHGSAALTSYVERLDASAGSEFSRVLFFPPRIGWYGGSAMSRR